MVELYLKRGGWFFDTPDGWSGPWSSRGDAVIAYTTHFMEQE